MAEKRYSTAKKITLIGALVNAFLGIIKLIGGVIFHSHGLFADGVHSFSDLITDIMVIFASKYGSQDADDTHPYGHQRIETAATLMLSLLLILAGLGIAYDAIIEMINKTHDMPRAWALLIALFSTLANEVLFRYTQYIGHRIHSNLIVTNAWHHRSDAAASLVVLIGLAGSMMGLIYLDTIAAIVVGFMIIKMGWTYGWSSIKELVDTAIEAELLTKVSDIIMKVDGVYKIHQLRSRLMGRDIFIDVHIIVAPYISVSEGHYIAQHVHQTLVNHFEYVKDVTVHVDPEDDEIMCPSFHLPNRHVLTEKFLKNWQQAFPELVFWFLHYLDGILIIDLFCKAHFKHWQQLKKHVQADLVQEPSIEIRIRLFEQHDQITRIK